MILAIAGAVGNAALASVTPIYVGKSFSLLQMSAPEPAILGSYALIIAGTQLTRALFQWFRSIGFELVAQRVECDIRGELFISLLGKSMTFHSLQPVGDTMSRATNDVREINYLFSPGLNLVVGSLVFVAIPPILAPRYDAELIITPLIFIVLYVVSLWRFLKQLAPVTDDVRTSFGSLNTRLSEALDGIETVKGSAQEKSEMGRFGKNADRYRNAAIRQGDIEAKYIPMLLYSLALVAGFAHAYVLFHAGRLTLGEMVGYFGLLLLLDFPTFISLFAYSQISLGISGARRILDLLNRENNLDQNSSGCRNPLAGEVEFRDVSFSYNGKENTLEHVNFRVKPGQTVAIVGQTGSGKTTLTKLINRTYDASGGSVLVDGVNVRDWNLEALRKGISIIEQDVFLFSRSVAENIAFGVPDAKMDDIINAAKMAQAHDFIMSFDQQYQTVLGERGVTVSGGQRQRLALARAFLTNPSILILDDSTSAIDSNTEDRIQRAIYAAAHGRTTFIITHRLSQIRWADLIIVLRKGKIAAIGKHEDLLLHSESYRKIFTET